MRSCTVQGWIKVPVASNLRGGGAGGAFQRRNYFWVNSTAASKITSAVGTSECSKQCACLIKESEIHLPLKRVWKRILNRIVPRNFLVARLVQMSYLSVTAAHQEGAQKSAREDVMQSGFFTVDSQTWSPPGGQLRTQLARISLGTWLQGCLLVLCPCWVESCLPSWGTYKCSLIWTKVFEDVIKLKWSHT